MTAQLDELERRRKEAYGHAIDFNALESVLDDALRLARSMEAALRAARDELLTTGDERTIAPVIEQIDRAIAAEGGRQ